MKLIFSSKKHTRGVTIAVVNTKVAINRTYESANLSEKKDKTINFLTDSPKTKEILGILYLDI